MGSPKLTESLKKILTKMVVTIRVLLTRLSEMLMSNVVAFIARVLLEYHTPICREGRGGQKVPMDLSCCTYVGVEGLDSSDPGL